MSRRDDLSPDDRRIWARVAGSVTPRKPKKAALVKTGATSGLGDDDLLGLLGGGGDEAQGDREHHRDVVYRKAQRPEGHHQPRERVGQRDRRGRQRE